MSKDEAEQTPCHHAGSRTQTVSGLQLLQRDAMIRLLSGGGSQPTSQSKGLDSPAKFPFIRARCSAMQCSRCRLCKVCAYLGLTANRVAVEHVRWYIMRRTDAAFNASGSYSSDDQQVNYRAHMTRRMADAEKVSVAALRGCETCWRMACS